MNYNRRSLSSPKRSVSKSKKRSLENEPFVLKLAVQSDLNRDESPEQTRSNLHREIKILKGIIRTTSKERTCFEAERKTRLAKTNDTVSTIGSKTPGMGYYGLNPGKNKSKPRSKNPKRPKSDLMYKINQKTNVKNKASDKDVIKQRKRDERDELKVDFKEKETKSVFGENGNTLAGDEKGVKKKAESASENNSSQWSEWELRKTLLVKFLFRSWEWVFAFLWLF